MRCVSIHAPVKERLKSQLLFDRADFCFNPRSREGATKVVDQYFSDTAVSIHAPVKERRIAAGETVNA